MGSIRGSSSLSRVMKNVSGVIGIVPKVMRIVQNFERVYCKEHISHDVAELQGIAIANTSTYGCKLQFNHPHVGEAQFKHGLSIAYKQSLL